MTDRMYTNKNKWISAKKQVVYLGTKQTIRRRIRASNIQMAYVRVTGSGV